MKKLLFLFAILFGIYSSANSQVAINNDGTTANTTAILDVKSTSKGMLVPRLTSLQRTGITTPANGLMVFDTDTKSFWYYDGGASTPVWTQIISSNNNSELSDADGDTKISVQESWDDDVIRFDMGGTEYFTMENGRLEVNNTGQSVFMGYQAGVNDDLSNNDNAFVGYRSGASNTTGEDNVAFGYRTLFNNQTGGSNSAFGSNSLYDNVGHYNTAIGARTLEDNATGNYNTAIGALSMYQSKATVGNTAVGAYSLREHKRNNNNTAIGMEAMFSDTSGSYNTAVGSYSLRSNINGSKNTALGYGALYSSEGADENTAVGYYALSNSAAGNNTAMGSHSLYYNSDGNRNTAIGYKSSYSNTNGSYNTSVGDSSLYSNTEGFLNTAIGHAAMYANTTTWHSVAIGTAAMKNTNGGADNTAVGDSALFTNVSGSYNTALGNSALQGNIGSRNTAVGGDALKSNSGTVNTGVGYQSLLKNSTGYFNVGVGGYTLKDNTVGYSNTVVGYNSGQGIITGDNNTIIGAGVTGLSSDLNNNIIIADGEGNQRIRVLSDGKVGIGTTTPDTKLNVYSASAAEPIAHFQSDDDVAIRVNGQGGESYVEIQNDDTGTGNSWKLGVNDNTALSLQYGTAGTMNSNTEGLKISTAGYVYKPKMPYFLVFGNTTVISTGSATGANVDFDTEKFDNGNNFDLTTNKFTAPVKGIYTFSWDIQHDDGQDMGGGLGYFIPGYLVTSDGSTSEAYPLDYQETSDKNAYSMSAIIELNSGEQAWVRSFAFDDFEIIASQFSGYLVTALE